MKRIKLTKESPKPIYTSMKTDEAEKIPMFSFTNIDEETIEKVFDKSYRSFTNIDFKVIETVELRTT